MFKISDDFSDVIMCSYGYIAAYGSLPPFRYATSGQSLHSRASKQFSHSKL